MLNCLPTSWIATLNCPLLSNMMLNCTDVLHDVKLHRRDLGPAWQAGCHAQAPYGAGPYQGVCGTAVAEYMRGMVAGAVTVRSLCRCSVAVEKCGSREVQCVELQCHSLRQVELEIVSGTIASRGASEILR
jgi:hypothetical protein